MNSKLNGILFAQNFTRQNDGQNLYLKLYNAIVLAIVDKKLVQGDTLPPTRLLAKDLKISRSTVIKAYEILTLEECITSVRGSGYFVNDVQQKKIQYRTRTTENKGTYPKVSKKAQQFRKHVTLINRSEYKGIAFRPGLPPLDIFPVRQWQSLTNMYWKDLTLSDMSYQSAMGLESLRKNIAHYLKIYRNIHCDYQQIIIVTGSLHSLSLISDMLLDEGDQVVIEDPTYANAIAIFKSLNANIIPAHIDNEGINLKSIKRRNLKHPKLVYTTPSNQYPTGIQMSLDRRLEVLDWADQNNCLIVEDDYDHEFSNWSTPITSIFGLDTGHRVIYQGTFNKLLHPSIRLGYLIVPPYLIEDIKAIYEQSLRFVSPITQKVMSTFIERDYLSRHIRKVVQISNERRQFFIDCFASSFEKDITLHPVNKGLHLIAKLPDAIDDIALSKFLDQNGIIAFPYSKYFFKNKKEKGLVMGFSSVSEPVIKRKLSKMSELYRKFILL